MLFHICFFVSLILFVVSIFVAIICKKKKDSKLLKPLNVLILGTILSSIFIFLPCYVNEFYPDKFFKIKAVLLSIHNTIRLFVVDGDFEIIVATKDSLPELVYLGYSVFSAIIFVLAPVLTFGFVLSFFEGFSSYLKLLINRTKDIYIFSELNEKSLILAKSIKEKDTNSMIVFSGYNNDSDDTLDLHKNAKSIGSLIFNDDIISFNYKKRSSKVKLTFIILNENEPNSNNQALAIIDSYRNRKNTEVYLFSDKTEAEIIFEKTDKGEIKFRRINTTRLMVNSNLYENGRKIFDYAVKDENGVNKISAVILGLGDSGVEMLKALSWFCQMDNYQVTITGLDAEKKASKKVELLCPELLDEKHNGNFTDDGESQYSITIHDDVDVFSSDLTEKLTALKTVSYVFISLGDDERNIKAAINVRMLCERLSNHPYIQTVIFNSKKIKSLSGATNYSGNEYDINYIGGLNETYSVKNVFSSYVCSLALERHLKWGDENDFWKFEYNYYSSMASAIHKHLKDELKVPGIEKPSDSRTEEEKLRLRKLEHRRWNAYMRSEGYSWSGSIEKSSRNNLAKLHHCLVTFDELPDNEKIKDDD